MNLALAIKNIIIYKEPKNTQIFELLEDEQEDMKSGADHTSYGNDTSAAQSLDNSNNVYKELNKNIEEIKREFHFPTNKDIVIREFKVMRKTNACIVYIDGMADKGTINDYILRQLMTDQEMHEDTKISIDYITNNLLAINQITKHISFDQIIMQILNGLTALFVEGCEECIIIESRGYDKRNVGKPEVETVIKGPEEGFTENMRTNLTLVRKIIRNNKLITEFIPLGKTDNLTCAIMYINGITNPKVVQEVKRRITGLDVDIITGGGGLEQLIEDHPLSLFSQLLSTERPDKTALYLMYGKIAIFCEGSPYASLAPITFFHFFHSPEDFDLRWQFGTFLRLIRLIAANLALFLPGLFIALTLYHQEMIPTELLFALSNAREHIPLPTLFELLAMEITFELIREAGLRIPGAIGQALGVLGAIVLGQAAVAAGLASPILIMIVSITGLSSFAIPNYSIAFAIRLLRFAYTILGTIAGLYGIAAGIVIFGGFICSMKSFGVPYFSPVAPKTKAEHNIVIIAPPWTLKERADYLNTVNRSRTGGTVRGWIRQDKRGNDK